jgi:hypothetical protein
MPANFRQFEARDLFGRTWKIEFLWLQNGISIRHADTIDVKFELSSGDIRASKVIALMHPYLLELSRKAGRPVTDAWCSRLAALHLKRMLATGEDLDKALVTPTCEMLEEQLPLLR